MKYIEIGKVAKIDRTIATHEECINLPYVGLEHIEKGTGQFTHEYNVEPEELLATKFRFTSTHVLYGKLRPYLNKVALPDFDGVCTTEILPILPDPNQLDRRYLWGILLTPEFVQWATNAVIGANLPRLSPDDLTSYCIPVPPLDEQRRIAAILCAADDERRRRRYMQSLSNSLLREMYVQIFGDPVTNPMGWQVKPLGEILETPPQNGLYVPPEEYTNLKDPTGIEMVHMSDLFYDVVERGQLKRVRRNVKKIEQYFLTTSDLLIARRSLNYEGAAKPCLIPDSKEPLIFESSMIRIRPDRNCVHPIYLFCYLSNPSARAAYVFKHVTVSTISGINQDALVSIEVVVPPIRIQNHFAAIIAEHEQIRRQQTESVRQSDHLFQTLLHRAFRGEL